MTAVTERHREMTRSRSEFGAGYLGSLAWELIRQGARCEARINGGACGRPAIGTTDWDLLGDATLTPHCSQQHHVLIRQQVEAELTALGRSTEFGINGFGRA